MKILKFFPITIGILCISSGCQLINSKNSLETIKIDGLKIEKSNIETIEISISCNKDNIQKYLQKGWSIQSSESSEVPCSWKTAKSSKDCNLKKDKGCKITVPDMMGEKIDYILEKKINSRNSK
ncbi:alpha-2-macroglobulin [Prochlorococcus marinus]|uniref:alpha-2-macroglobulin n=1 Tax=Prochlorococcus marinus TaxID=1219 RepID=UPI0022B5BF5D|nr:alpha-2-macroglobulin [Prochlorococcus marinus]